jgi:hypothetical protein
MNAKWISKYREGMGQGVIRVPVNRKGASVEDVRLFFATENRGKDSVNHFYPEDWHIFFPLGAYI